MSSLLSGLNAQEPDKILRLMAMFAEDPRSDKIDLGVGVYKTSDGKTPVLAAVQEAEARILNSQTTKGYVALTGDKAFHTALGNLVLGPTIPQGRVAALATPGGTGAVRQGLELVARARPGAKVWISDPTWPNHPAILEAMNMRYETYRYFDPATGDVDLEGLLADLSKVEAGDIVLLHGCCHNPTGADLSVQDWSDVTEILGRRGAVPLIDLAYLGFGKGLDEDAAGLRAMAARLPEVLIAVSGSKNFGLYRERVGLLLVLCASSTDRQVTEGTLAWLNRLSYAFPPDHGARVVTEILSDPALFKLWADELSDMRDRINTMRQALAQALREECGDGRFDGLARHRGMFSLLGATPEQVTDLRETHGVYIIGDSRINVAGLTPDNVAPAAKAIAAVMAG